MLENSQCIDFWSGKETFKDSSAETYIFEVVPNHKGKSNPERALNKSKTPGVERVNSQKHEAAPGLIRSLGEWYYNTYSIPDGVILKVFHNRFTGISVRREKAMLYLAARASGPRLSVAYRLSGDSKAAFSVHRLTGRFDIITPADFAEYGIHPPRPFRAFMESSIVEHTFDIEVLEAEIKAKAKAVVKTIVVSGQEHQIKKNVRNRKLRIKR